MWLQMPSPCANAIMLQLLHGSLFLLVLQQKKSMPAADVVALQQDETLHAMLSTAPFATAELSVKENFLLIKASEMQRLLKQLK